MNRPPDSSGGGPARGALCRQRELGADAHVLPPEGSCFDDRSMSSTESLPPSKRDAENCEESHVVPRLRHSPAGPPANDTSPNTDTDTQLLYQVVKHPRRFPHPSIWPLPNDTLHFPTLAAKSLDLQTREMFNASLCSVLIPETYAAFSKRLDQDIVAFVRDDQRAQCPPIQWAVRCYASWHLATLHSDADLLAQSRYIYGILIRYLQSALGDPRRSTSQTTLTVALLMGIYEVFDGSSPDAWLVHIRGAKEILKRRGAAAHSSGFARTIVFSCRAFFIVEALISCEECFLAEQEWASVNARAFEREDRQGRGCRLVTLMDRTYREVVRVPGLVARTKAVLGTDTNKGGEGLMAGGKVGDDAGAAMASREELRIQIQRSQTTLRRLGRGLSSLSPEETMPKDQHGEYIVDSRFVSPIIRHNLYAASAVEESLGRLSAMLADSKEPDPTFKELRLVEIPSESQTLTSDIMSPSLASRGSTGLDFLFLSLGVRAL